MSTVTPVNPLAVPAMAPAAPPAAAVAQGPTGAGVAAHPVVSLPQPHAGQSGPHHDGNSHKESEKKPSGAKSGVFGLGFLGLGGSRRRRRGSKRSRRSKKTRKTRGKRKGSRR